MSYSDLSFRALSVLHKSRYLFNKHGFHNVGVDRIVREAEVPKASFITISTLKNGLLKCAYTFKRRLKRTSALNHLHTKRFNLA